MTKIHVEETYNIFTETAEFDLGTVHYDDDYGQWVFTAKQASGRIVEKTLMQEEIEGIGKMLKKMNKRDKKGLYAPKQQTEINTSTIALNPPF